MKLFIILVKYELKMALANLINLMEILSVPCALFGLNIDIIPSTSFSLTILKYIDF